MKEEHRKALLEGDVLRCPTGYLLWQGTSGYFNCCDPDCLSCEDRGLTWGDIEWMYGYWNEDEWEIE